MYVNQPHEAHARLTVRENENEAGSDKCCHLEAGLELSGDANPNKLPEGT